MAFIAFIGGWLFLEKLFEYLPRFCYSNLHEKLSSAFRRWFRQSSLEWRFQFAPQDHSQARTTVVQFTTHARSVSRRSARVPRASGSTVSVPYPACISHN